MNDVVKRMVALGLLLLCAGCGSGFVLVPEYHGRYADHPAMKEVLANWPSTFEGALAQSESVVRLNRSRPCRVEIFDIPASAEGITRFDGSSAVTESDGNEIVIRIPSHLLVAGRLHLRTELSHELIHANMRSWLTEEQYLAIPTSVREGLAIWGSGGGRDLVEYYLADPRFTDRCRDLLNEERLEGRFDYYPAWYMIMDAVSRHRGGGWLRDRVRSVETGSTDRLMLASREIYDERFAVYLQSAEFELSAWSKQSRFRYLLELREAAGSAPHRVPEIAERLAEASRTHRLKGICIYYRLDALGEDATAEDARKAIEQSLLYPRSGMVDDTLLVAGEVLRRDGALEEASVALSSLVEFYPDSSVLPEGVVLLARTLAEQELREEAIDLLRRFLKSWPEHELAGAVRTLMSGL
jgi:tetratricopeptide (TPR) repeat protein